MLKKTLLFLLLAMPALWAYAQGNDVLQVDVKTTITLGKLDGNKRYLKPFVKVGDIYHAFYGCHVYDTVRVVPRANKLVDVQVYYGTSPCKGKIIGDSCVFVSDFEPECTQYNNIYAKITEDKGDPYNVPLNSLFIHPRPAIEKISYETTSTSDIEGLQFQKAVVHDDTGILTGWQYKWTEKKQNDTIAPTVIGTHQTIETLRKNDVAGDEMAYDEYDYRVICENVAPDNSTIWYSDTLSVMSVRYYNSPKAPKGIGRLNVGDKTIYYAAGMDMTDEQLREKAYWFSFDYAEEPTGSRYLINPGSTPRNVRSVWKYTADV
ncbi:MAG: hypothetical protein HUK08_02785, partial [Bacteroidaceae bacterium]|nr:hypothetical protein [Bacteroidaceae bacterium]